MSNFLTKERNI